MCSYSLSHPFSFDHNYTCTRVRWGKHGTYETLTTPAPLTVPESPFNDRALGSDLLQPIPSPLHSLRFYFPPPQPPSFVSFCDTRISSLSLVPPEYSEPALKVLVISVGRTEMSLACPSAALLYPAYKNNKQPRGSLGQVCATGMYRFFGHVEMSPFLAPCRRGDASPMFNLFPPSFARHAKSDRERLGTR